MDLSDDEVQQHAAAIAEESIRPIQVDGHVVEGWPARLVGQRASAVARPGTRQGRPATVDQSR
jgi:hypothetical protein